MEIVNSFDDIDFLFSIFIFSLNLSTLHECLCLTSGSWAVWLQESASTAGFFTTETEDEFSNGDIILRILEIENLKDTQGISP